MSMRSLATAAGISVSLTVLPINAAELSITLSGTAFEGSPAFEVGLGGTVVGSGTLDNPVPAQQTFSFEIADDLLTDAGDLTVRLTNDYFTGEGQDRSLSILEATVGATNLAPTDFVLVQNGAPIDRDNSAEVSIWSGDETAVANPPSGGWSADTLVAEKAAAARECTAFAEIVGFPSGSSSPNSPAQEGLRPLIEAAAAGNCSATITGYADLSGSELLNLRLTAARAADVLDKLIVGGARFPATSIVPTSGTDQFGGDAAANRRVSVQLWSTEPQPVAPPIAAPENSIDELARQSREADLAHLLVLGWRNNGELYVRSSNTDPKEVLWLLEQTKARLIAGDAVLGAEQ
ncbi:carbohydrate-binding domain-containing protein [Devosia submarina]|uniref:carbohydrate-binding domain-containing protein n=1 Tax=Devosia submarina TaxID=1173082 RepID=UPI000D35EE27|nr:carbohydrate-binding domain-containing protein [Devosia submarina]